jgi:hypothetical protein
LSVPTHYYTEVPGVIPHPFPGDAKTSGPAIVTSPRVLMEHQLMDLRVVAYRALPLDGRVVFRIEDRFLTRIPWKDPIGYFIEIMKVKYYWSPTNPVTDGVFFHEWGPL